MQYLIRGSMIGLADLRNQNHDEFVKTFRSYFVPALQVLNGEIPQGRILGGGTPAGGKDVVLLVDLAGDSHHIVRQFLVSLPFFEFYEWEATPLESFEELLESFAGEK